MTYSNAARESSTRIIRERTRTHREKAAEIIFKHRSKKMPYADIAKILDRMEIPIPSAVSGNRIYRGAEPVESPTGHYGSGKWSATAVMRIWRQMGFA